MRRRTWALVSAGVVALVALPIVATAPLPSGSIRGVAARFDPPGGTEIGGMSVEPRRLLCLGDNPCPSAARSWELPGPVTAERLTAWLDAAGYRAAVDCSPAAGSCQGRGTADGWRIDVWTFPSDSSTGAVRLTLSVRPGDATTR